MMNILDKCLLNFKQMKKNIDPLDLNFETTLEVEPLEGIIGQERALKATHFGLAVKKAGYNIFMTGLTGTGKTWYAENALREHAKNEKTPEDICYLYNFQKPTHPLCVKLTKGLGKELKKDMEEFIEKLPEAILKIFSGENYEEKRCEILNKYKSERKKYIEDLKNFADEMEVTLKNTSSGYMTIPLIDGKELTNEEFDALDEDLQNELEDKSLKVQQKVLDVLDEVELIEKNAKEEMQKLQKETALIVINYFLCVLKTKYNDNEKLLVHFKELKEDIMKNLIKILPKFEDDEDAKLSLKNKEVQEKLLFRYQVNLVVDNSDLEGAPVVMEFNPTFQNLFGKIEYENDAGAVTTNFMKIKGGALHRANGGYLVVQAKDLLTNPYVWDTLKRTLKTKNLIIEDMRELIGYVSISSLKPLPINIDLKVVLLGHPYIYYLLFDKDEDFRKLFKIKAVFDSEMICSKEHINHMASFISYHCRKENLKHFHKTAVVKVIEYSTRLASNQNKLTTRFNELLEIIYEADTYAKMENAEFVYDKHVMKAIKEKRYRLNLYEEKIFDQIAKGNIMISVEGKKVGEINGLSVIDLGDYMIGKPNKITATTYMGRNGVINIERETKMSGSIHDKGLLILTGYLGEKFAQEYPLTLSAKLCFEQLYGGVDGDSASSTELYVLLSSLAEVPIKQGIAVTGSVNQKGEVQPVGGITEKIEGFYYVCKNRGFTGEQGVIIPRQNVSDLVLNDEVIDAVKKNDFHIYAIDNIKEGIEILTGVKAGKKDLDGNFEEGTIYDLVDKKFKDYRKRLLKIRKND